MTTNLEQRVVYERLQNGMDVYLLKGSSPDVVVAEFAFPGGEYATYDVPVITSLLELMLPGSVKGVSRNDLLESIDRLGATVSVRVDDAHLCVTVASRRVVFGEVLRTVVRILTVSTFPPNEFGEALLRVQSSLGQARENTRAQAQEALLRTLYCKGHPHWTPDIPALLRMLSKVTRKDVVSYYNSTLTSVGSVACIVGDIDTEVILALMREVWAVLPNRAPFDTVLHVDHVPEHVACADTVISIRDKMNIDTYLGIPTLLTRESAAYLALQIGVSVLGGSSTSRLFSTLRTRQSLTYGAYAALRGFSDGYPGYLSASAIFPNDVFLRAREAFRDVVKSCIEKGITAKELAARKIEMRGRYAVGLSTTSGLCTALFSTILSGRTVRYLDEYMDRIDALTLREVNNTIQTHLPYDRAVTVAAGAVDKDGKPI